MAMYDAVKRYCEKKGLSVMAFEQATGLSNGTVRKWQEHSPTLATLAKLAMATDWSVERWVREAQKSA